MLRLPTSIQRHGRYDLPPYSPAVAEVVHRDHVDALGSEGSIELAASSDSRSDQEHGMETRDEDPPRHVGVRP